MKSSNTRKKQWLWFVGLYVASLVVIGGFTFIMRYLLSLVH